ncbi:aquaporin-like protein, partial [Coprinopsis sp. MPI-PUGE-AT-0042]
MAPHSHIEEVHVSSCNSSFQDKKVSLVMDDLEASRVVDQIPHSAHSAPRGWRKARAALREPMAEFIGAALILIFGAGAGCSVVLSGHPDVAGSSRGDWLSINIGWAVGVALGVWVSGGISGGHLNPAITLTMAVWRGFPWRKVPAFIAAQLLGSLVGAAIIYGSYFHAIDIFEGAGIRTQATAGIFATFSLPYMSAASSFFAEFLATGILAMMILAMTDKRNMSPIPGLFPVAIFLLLVGVGTSLGMQTAYALNPARDFGPRIFLAMAGYGKAIFTFKNHYWLWCPILGPICGAQAGAFVYDFFLNDDSTLLDRDD